jgi:NADH dehydrogenase [ubiquinone] 1 alpha subcomplex assembly factor 1
MSGKFCAVRRPISLLASMFFSSTVLLAPFTIMGPSAASELVEEVRVEAASVRLFDFGPDEESWASINDGVMGGVSSGSIRTAKGIATFKGRVRLDNNGGFASTRSKRGAIDVSPDQQAFVLRAYGDGKTYQFTVDTEDGWFWASISPTKDVWSTIEVPFSKLLPKTRFGETMKRNAFDGTQSINALGLLIANKKPERFSISVDWIDVR